MDHLTNLIPVGLGAVLLISGPSKLFAPRALTGAISTVLPVTFGEHRLRWLVRALGVAELLMAVAVWLRPQAIVVNFAVCLLAGAIISFAIVALLRKVSVPCGCFGALDDRSVLGWRNLCIATALGAGSFILMQNHSDLKWKAEMRTVLSSLAVVLALVSFHLKPTVRLVRFGLGKGQ
jgi:methylamine utilization protein MauE